MNVFEEISSWSADEFVRRTPGLTLAKDGKTCECPVCGKGKGGDGLHARYDPKYGKVYWKCFGSCGRYMSNIELAKEIFGLNNCNDKAELAKRLSAEYGLPDDFSSSGKKSARATVDNRQEKSEPKNYEASGFYERCRANVAKFLDEHGGSYRGLTRATFKKYGLGIAKDFPAGGVKADTLIMPYDDYHFAARKLVEVAGSSKLTRHGQGAGLFVAKSIENASVIYIFEGELDALSAAQVTSNENIGIVATGGASAWRKVIPALEEKFADAERKPSVMSAFDNDTKSKENPGKVNSEKLVAALKAAGYPAVSCFFNNDDEPKVDANDLLQRDADELRDWLRGFYYENSEELSNQRTEFEKAALERAKIENEAALAKVGIKQADLAKYFTDKFIGDLELSAKYSRRETGFKNLDTAQIFLPGVYVLGGKPATGKTTFAWQMLNQLANKGETCIYCSYEMSQLELFMKSAAREVYKRNSATKLTNAKIRRGWWRDDSDFADVVEKLKSSTASLKVLEVTNASAAELIEVLNKMTGGKSATIVIDYLQIIPAKDTKSTVKEKVDEAMLRFKNFQRETNSTLIILSSFNRQNYNDNAQANLGFSAFKESGAIEYSADVLWGLVHDVPHGSKIETVRLIKLQCLKNRNGSPYECQFSYDAAHDYFDAGAKLFEDFTDARAESRDNFKKYIR
ncbi:MAG: toprim domain-containing protein [Treponema sp.]|nr:toprim domain-containing protein [Treponema sp.]